MSPTRGKIAASLWLAAFALRLLAVVLWSTPDIGKADQSEYLALGQNIRAHGAFSYGVAHRWGEGGTLNAAGPYEPSTARAPLYPLMIAALWWQEAPPLLEVRLAQAAMGATVVALVYLMTLQMFGARAALVAGLAMTFAPLSIYTGVLLLSETLFSFLLTTGLWFWGRKQGFIAGLLLGAATLTRAVLSPLLAAIGVMAILFRFNRATHLKIVFGAVLVIAPWTVRNAITQHAFIPVASMGWGANIFLATIDVPYGSGNIWALLDEDGTFSQIIRSSDSEREAERRMLEAGVARIAAAPGHWLLVRLKQYPRLFVGAPNYLPTLPPMPATLLKAAFVFGSALFFLLAVTGVVFAGPRWREAYYLALFPIFLCVVQFPALTEERYSLGIVPMCAVFAGFALCALHERALGRWRTRRI